MLSERSCASSMMMHAYLMREAIRDVIREVIRAAIREVIRKVIRAGIRAGTVIRRGHVSGNQWTMTRDFELAVTLTNDHRCDVSRSR